MSTAFGWVRLDCVTTCGQALGSYASFIPRAARLILLASFFVPLTLGTASAGDNPSELDKLKKTLIKATESLHSFYGDGNHIEKELENIRNAIDTIGLRRRQTFLEQRSGTLKAWLDSEDVIKTDKKLIQSLNSLIDTATDYEGLDRSNAAHRRAQRLLDTLNEQVTWRNDPSWDKLENVLKRLETIERMYPISALNRRSNDLQTLVDQLAQGNNFSGAACKTLIDSERRKNTQASNDVRARQLVRF